MSFDRDKLIAELTHDEGRLLKPYVDTVGKVTIGVGHNLTDVGITDADCDRLLESDIARTELDLDRHLSWWRTLDDVRQRVLLNMCFNLGLGRLLGFRKALAAMQTHQWNRAAHEMLWNAPGVSTNWASQVGARAERLAEAMATGEMPST